MRESNHTRIEAESGFAVCCELLGALERQSATVTAKYRLRIIASGNDYSVKLASIVDGERGLWNHPTAIALASKCVPLQASASTVDDSG